MKVGSSKAIANLTKSATHATNYYKYTLHTFSAPPSPVLNINKYRHTSCSNGKIIGIGKCENMHISAIVITKSTEKGKDISTQALYIRSYRAKLKV